jgi:hypothetical protein
MADHIISLSARREEALQKILDDINRPVFEGHPWGAKTKDDLLRDWCLGPILERIRRDRVASSETLRQQYIRADLQSTNRTLHENRTIGGGELLGDAFQSRHTAYVWGHSAVQNSCWYPQSADSMWQENTNFVGTITYIAKT